MRTPDSLSIPITFASTPSGVWMMSLTRTSKCFRSASDVSISFFLPLPFLPPFFGMVEVRVEVAVEVSAAAVRRAVGELGGLHHSIAMQR